MNKIIVNGGKRLTGEVAIGGSKNAALPILFAGILTADVCVFSALPRVSDVLIALELLRCLGARIRFLENGDVVIDYRDMRPVLPSPALTGAIRGSVYLLGAMLGRFGKAQLAGAGGCDFGTRPIDQHLMGFSLLGAAEEQIGDTLCLSAKKGLNGAEIRLKMPSVGASANLMMAATAANGETLIKNAAAEPHVCALGDFLAAAGAELCGVGTDTVRVWGGKPLHGCHFTVIPDMIEAGTYLAACMATGGEITVTNVDPTHLEAVLLALREMGAAIRVTKTAIFLRAPESYKSLSLQTGPYPAFPTDLHPQFATLFALAPRATGEGSVDELVFDSRFRYTEELAKMGAIISINERRATFTPSQLSPTQVRSPDLRGGAALLIAALAIKGRTEITNAAQLGRGYEHLEGKLQRLGADVRIYG